MTNCKVDVYRLTGDDSRKVYTLYRSSVRMLILPAGTEAQALYGDAPVGGLFECMAVGTMDHTVTEDKYVVRSAMKSGLNDGDELIVKGISQQTYILGFLHIKSLAVRSK